MDNDIKISIIVPIYNTGIYLNKCIESLLNQTLRDIEIILVDDGSIDESGNICDRYAQNDHRVKVIHKKNEGVSIARNIGIKKAKGEYIGFIDSDDWIKLNMYENLYNYAKNEKADIVFCDVTTVYDDKKNEPDTFTNLNKSQSLNKKDINAQILVEIAGSACRGLYKRELLENNNILFPINLKFSEDRVFNLYAIGYSKKIYYDKCSYYNRYIRKGSAVNKYYNNMIDIVMDARSRIMQAILVCWNNDENIINAYEKQAVGLCYVAINNEFYKDSKKNFKDSYAKIKKICNNQILRNSIKKLNLNDLRAIFIIKKYVFFLCLIAIILNKKYSK